MGITNVKLSRRRSPWRIIRGAHTVVAFSRSRSRAESRHCADYAMGLRRTGVDGEIVVDGRFSHITAAMAARLREDGRKRIEEALEEEGRVAQVWQDEEDIRPTAEIDATKGHQGGIIASPHPQRRRQRAGLHLISRHRREHLVSEVRNDSNGLEDLLGFGEEEEDFDLTSTEDIWCLSQGIASIDLDDVAIDLDSTYAPGVSPREIRPLPISEISRIEMWRCCQCYNNGMGTHLYDSCLLCRHQMCQACYTFHPTYEADRTNRFAEVRHGGHVFVSSDIPDRREGVLEEIRNGCGQEQTTSDKTKEWLAGQESTLAGKLLARSVSRG